MTASTWLLSTGPSLRYILRMGLTSLLPSIAVAVAIVLIVTPFGVEPSQITPDFTGPSRIVTFIAVVVISPIVETLMMSAGIGVISLLTRKPLVIAALSALLWASLHSAVFLAWGLVIAWPFFVFSCVYLAWRPQGWLKAVTIAASIHMFQNLLPGALLFLT